MLQTQDKIMQNWSGSVDTSSGRHEFRSCRHECPFQTKTHDYSAVIHFHLL
ncbi:hypothetical protein Taro_002783 [Colocasia esculenta]|uniref:Uncharacterized protein n=1 Tax=Colocasia esculenta TaxID=4460 RepID=A0A843TMF8_COLES|nr:hypothetical protein [Colocasia esculenta]